MKKKKRILDMVANGKISSHEAEKLLKALNPKSKQTNKKNSKFIIRITNENEEFYKLNVVLPLSLFKFGLKLLPKPEKLRAEMSNTNFDFSRINWQEIYQMIEAGEKGDLIYMDYEENDGTISTLRIFVE